MSTGVIELDCTDIQCGPRIGSVPLGPQYVKNKSDDYKSKSKVVHTWFYIILFVALTIVFTYYIKKNSQCTE
jgi:hypothetical protein